MGQIRQDSITHAIDKCAHYFVADCDNFITPDTIQTLFDNKNMGVIAPMLVSQIAYSNFHYECTDTGYYADHENYMPVLNRKITGLISVKVVHCTYFINNNILQHVLYNDNSYRYEYVIFSDVLRKNNITQYLDNRNNYGFLVFEDNKNDFDNSIITNWEKQQKEIFNT